MTSQEVNQHIFKRLKVVCVPLLGASLLTPASVPDVLKYLSDLNTILLDFRASGSVLTPDLISYTFFPLSTLLRRNSASDIPDQILEKIFFVLSILCKDWWWDCDITVWEQLFVLCGAVIAGMDGKENRRVRAHETKQAAGECLLALLFIPTDKTHSNATLSDRIKARLEILKTTTGSNRFLPVLGQTLDSLLVTVDTPHLPLQRVCLSILSLIIGNYAPDGLLPSVLPGIVSRMTRIALGTSTKKGWANGEIVSGSLEVMQLAIVRTLGNDICAQEGAIHPIVKLEDLVRTTMDQPDLPLPEPRPFTTLRTPSWLRGTSSQVLIALNTLTPLVTHPTPSALLAVSRLSVTLLSATSMTLPEVQPLLLHWLLSLSNSDYLSVSTQSRESLSSLLMTPSEAQVPLQHRLVRITNDSLSALPQLLITHADTKVEHVAGLIEAVCRLVYPSGEAKEGASFISNGIGRLLGPSGGIEKWGWSLLSVLELSTPQITFNAAFSGRLMLESNTNITQWEGFPEIDFKNVFSITAKKALERMFRALGRASGDSCLFSIEWFTSVGRNGVGARLSRRWLDIEATKVLLLMVRFVGSDIIERAGDVVEECYDRLDDFHGYTIIVEGLVEVLGEVLQVIQEDKKNDLSVSAEPSDQTEEARVTSMESFFDWLPRRHQGPVEEVDTNDYGPAPREGWGEKKVSESDPADDTAAVEEPDPNAGVPLTPIQELTKQIVSRSLYFLTHSSPVIRARILSLLASSVPVLSESALLPSIHYAWPFILNRLSDSESFVVSSAASLIESLATHFGSFMFRRIWDDVWPKFRALLKQLDAADATSALSRRGVGAVGTESAYTHSHRTYRSVIKTMTAAVSTVHLQETSTWQLLLAFRRFLHGEAHEELQQCARDLYLAVGKKEADAVWLVLSSTIDSTHTSMKFLTTPRWDIRFNVDIIFQNL
ncbi:hypothetical protein C0992_003973 [Termitomyces sp. T32_za158]|nr:hypothetical protein C0992_003973 [Termitomyces sp. T32_za158]